MQHTRRVAALRRLTRNQPESTYVRDAVATFNTQRQQADVADLLASKPFFKIGEVAKFLGVKPHVLRYWESEFPSLRPKKNPSGQRIYARADIEAVVEIKNLLYNERYTISGARRMLARRSDTTTMVSYSQHVTLGQALQQLKGHIAELLTLLEQTPRA